MADRQKAESPLDRAKRLTEEAQARVVVFEAAMRCFVREQSDG
jgi:hypothetical protein